MKYGSRHHSLMEYQGCFDGFDLNFLRPNHLPRKLASVVLHTFPLLFISNDTSAWSFEYIILL